jgi:hypothetical protein
MLCLHAGASDSEPTPRKSTCEVQFLARPIALPSVKVGFMPCASQPSGWEGWNAVLPCYWHGRIMVMALLGAPNHPA